VLHGRRAGRSYPVATVRFFKSRVNRSSVSGLGVLLGSTGKRYFKFANRSGMCGTAPPANRRRLWSFPRWPGQCGSPLEPQAMVPARFASTPLPHA